MTLYLYKSGTNKAVLTLEDVVSYTADRVVTEKGVYAPLAVDCELSTTPDCAGTLRADWREKNPATEKRLEEVEDVLAQILFGGETV